MTFHEFTEILFAVTITTGWLALSWSVGPEAFAHTAGFITCALLSIPYHLHMARIEKK